MLGVLFSAVVGATVKLYNVSAEDYPSEVESQDISKQRALEKAIKKAKKEAGVYLKTYSRSVNSELTDDEIIAITSNSYKIVGEPKYTREIVNHSDETSIIVWKVNVDVQVDDSEIQSWLKRDDKEKSTIISQTRSANEVSDENERKIEDLREQYNRATSQAERNSIIKQMNDADREFLANQKLEEGNKIIYDDVGGDYKRAIKLYNETLQLKPNWDLAYYNRGVAYNSLGQYELAIKDLNEAIKLNSNYADAYASRGTLYKALKNYEQAIINYDKAIYLSPNSESNYLARAWFYSESVQNYELAIQDFTKLIEMTPDKYFYYAERADMYIKLKNYTYAVKDLDESIRLCYQPHGFLYRQRAIAYHSLKNYNQAIKDYTSAIERDSEDSFSYYWRGKCYQELRENAKAQADFAKAKELGYNG